MAAAIARWLYGDEAGDWYFDLTRHSPNRLVHDMVFRELSRKKPGSKRCSKNAKALKIKIILVYIGREV